jgi:DNA processing protein
MELEQIRLWLSLAQQPYPIVREFLNRITVTEADSIFNQSGGCAIEDTGACIIYWLQKNSSKIDHHKVDKALDWLNGKDHYLLTFLDFPEQLKSIASPPAILFLAGNPQLINQPQIAIVGSRKPSNVGKENVAYFVDALVRAGLTITSGMARGIDGLAHRAALASGGQTIAVLGSGHNHCYPSQHRSLFGSIKNKGLIISEFFPDQGVRAHQFPRRNRIISGLSLAVLVIEAMIKSGSLITCKLAAEQGREVFAVPGDIGNSLTQGCHHLIRNGACLVDSPVQILQELNFLTEQVVVEVSPLGNKILYSVDEKKVLDSLNRNPITIDRIVSRSGMKMSLVLSVLFSLELTGVVIGSVDGFFKRQME